MENIKHMFQFGGNDSQIDDLALKTLKGEKTSTSSLYDYYLLGKKEMSRVGDIAVILNSNNEEVCKVRINWIEVVDFKNITEKFAKEEGDGSLENWLQIHNQYYSEQLNKINKELTPDTKLVCEWFSVVK